MKFAVIALISLVSLALGFAYPVYGMEQVLLLALIVGISATAVFE